MKEPRIHVVSFQTPWPPDYGGAIDVWYKLLALKAHGWHVTLHTFLYGSRHLSPALLESVDRVFTYRRGAVTGHLLSTTHMIVKSRADRSLLARLSKVPGNQPILFEGLHTTAWLAHPLLRDKIKIVRAHNVEHDYYRMLARSASSPIHKAFFLTESMKLRAYEKNLRHASAILAISEGDLSHFRQTFPAIRSELVPCFYSTPAQPFCTDNDVEANEPYLFYNGNLSVAENIESALYIINKITPLLPSGSKVVIAGKDPDMRLVSAAATHPEVTLIASPEEAHMQRLIRNAAVSLLVTSQPTGIKLKLLNTLCATRGHIVANSMMLNDSILRRLCHRADTPAAQAAAIARLMTSPPDSNELDQRLAILRSRFDNDRSALLIESVVADCLEGIHTSMTQNSNLQIS